MVPKGVAMIILAIVKPRAEPSQPIPICGIKKEMSAMTMPAANAMSSTAHHLSLVACVVNTIHRSTNIMIKLTNASVG